MKRDAESHAAEDLQKAELVKLRNVADQSAFEMERQLSEHGDKIPADERAKVESAINNLRGVLKGDDANAIKKAHEQLMKDAQNIGKIIYEKVAQAGGPGAAGGPGPGGFGNQGGFGGTPGGADGPGAPGGKDDVIDAEFEVKK